MEDVPSNHVPLIQSSADTPQQQAENFWLPIFPTFREYQERIPFKVHLRFKGLHCPHGPVVPMFWGFGPPAFYYFFGDMTM
jgi:hypothetical protein